MNKLILIIILLFSIVLNTTAQQMHIKTDTSQTNIDMYEVVVNASKNGSQLKKMPVSVSLIPSKMVESGNIDNLTGLTNIVPNFSMPDYGSKLTSPVYIRGIGSRINSPSVALYVDNVPYFEKSAFNFDFFDIESIEILRGPQGTLFGRNSMGGVINITTKSPLRYNGNHINLLAGNYGTYKANIGHYNKIGKKIHYSLSVNYQHNNGFYTNNFLNQQVDKLNAFAARNRFVYKVSAKMVVENCVSLEQSQQGGYPYAVYVDSTKKVNNIEYNQKSSYNRFLFNDAVAIKYKTGYYTIINNLSYQLLNDEQLIDQDFSVDSLYFVRQAQKQNNIANEFTIRYNKTEKYNWLTGFFAFWQQSGSDVDVNYYKNKRWHLKTYNNSNYGLAFFHQFSYNFTSKLTFTAGIRYDIEQAGLVYNYLATQNNMFLPAIDTTYPVLTDNKLLPKISLNYNFNKVMLYATFASGYKAGGFNTTFEKPEHLTFKNEISYNYEFGSKARLFNNMLYFDAAFFYTKLFNQQIYRTSPSGQGSYLDNSGLSVNKGFELSAQSNPGFGFNILLSYGYTNSKITEYIKDTITNYNNKYTPYIPKQTFDCQVNKTYNFKNNTIIDKVLFNINYNYKGLVYWDLNNKYSEPGYGILNAKVTVTKKNISFGIWGKNLTNKKYNAFLFEANKLAYVQTGKLFQAGINISVKF